MMNAEDKIKMFGGIFNAIAWGGDSSELRSMLVQGQDMMDTMRCGARFRNKQGVEFMKVSNGSIVSLISGQFVVPNYPLEVIRDRT